MSVPPSVEVYTHALDQVCSPIVDGFVKQRARLGDDPKADEKVGNGLLAVAAYFVGAAAASFGCDVFEAIDRLRDGMTK